MNILFVTDLYPIFENEPNMPLALRNFVLSWKKSGHNVFVLRPNLSLNTLLRGRKLYPEGIWEYEGVKILNKNYLLPSSYDVPSGKFDVLIAHMPQGILCAHKITKKLGVPLVCGVHSSDIAVLKRYPYFSRRLKQAYLASSKVMARSPWLLAEIKKIIPQISDKVHLAPSGVDEKYIVEPVFRGTKKFLTVAQLIGRKNLSNLINAFRTIQGEWSLDVIGTGPKERELRRLAKGMDVNFLGSLAHEKVLEKMREADVFILPSLNETFGLVYLEAMASGCITVCAQNSGVAGIIRDGENGFLCGTGVFEIAQKIQEIRAHKGLEGILKNAHEDISGLTKEFAAKKYLSYNE